MLNTFLGPLYSQSSIISPIKLFFTRTKNYPNYGSFMGLYMSTVGFCMDLFPLNLIIQPLGTGQCLRLVISHLVRRTVRLSPPPHTHTHTHTQITCWEPETNPIENYIMLVPCSVYLVKRYIAMAIELRPQTPTRGRKGSKSAFKRAAQQQRQHPIRQWGVDDFYTTWCESAANIMHNNRVKQNLTRVFRGKKIVSFTPVASIFVYRLCEDHENALLQEYL